MSAFSFECVKSHADSHVLHGVSPQDGTQSEGVYRIDALKSRRMLQNRRIAGSGGYPLSFLMRQKTQ